MWTDEAIDTLRRLALEGRSASSIAAALGAPSRNAVIGKANRIGVKLGSANCLAPGAARGGAERPRRAIPRSEPLSGGRTLPRRAAIPRSEPISGERALTPAFPRERERKASWIFADAEVGEMRRVGFLDIGRSTLQMAARRSDGGGFRLLRPRDGEGTLLLRRPLPDGLSSAEAGRERRRGGDGVHGGWQNPRIGRHQGDFTEMEVREPAEPAAERFAEAHRAADELL